MFQNTKCECGHQNHVGTVLCETCGKPLNEDGKQNAPLEMRYDGVARRSQKANPSLIDRVWNFFSSVKIAVYLIIITLVTSMLGTIYPQASAFIRVNASTYYAETYGLAGQIYYTLGLHRTYESWWFITLLVMIGTSLVVCSLDRVLPLYRALSKQQIRKHEQFLKRQKVVHTGEIAGDPAQWTSQFADQLRKQRYRVHVDGTALLAEKNRFSRWGPYINHIGLILFLLAVLARSIPGWNMDTYVTIPEGEIAPIDGTNYFIRNEKFTVDYYTDDELPDRLKGTMRAKLYETKATLFECDVDCYKPSGLPDEAKLSKVDEHSIQVNSPLSYKGLKAYQFDFSNVPLLQGVKPVIIDQATGESYGPFELSMKEPELFYEVGPYTLELREQYMDFALDANGEPTTLSRDPNAPAFLFIVKGPGLDSNGETFLYFPKEIDKQRFRQELINESILEKIDMRVGSMENVVIAEYTTMLNIRMDKAVKYIWYGAAISMIGLVMGFYWHHRRIWLRIDGNKLLLGAHTNKNWYGMRSDVAAALRKMGTEIDPKKLDNGGYNS